MSKNKVLFKRILAICMVAVMTLTGTPVNWVAGIWTE